MRWYLSIACSVYWLYIIISCYQRRVSLLSVIIREEYLGRARSVYHLYLIIEYYQMRWYLSIACSVYWLFMIISYYQRRVAWQGTQSLSLVPCYRVLSIEIVSQYSMQRVLVEHCYQLLSEWSSLVEHVEFITSTLLSSIIK